MRTFRAEKPFLNSFSQTVLNSDTLWGLTAGLAGSHLTQWQPVGWTSGLLFMDAVLQLHIWMLHGSQPFYGGNFVQVCSPWPTQSRSQNLKGLGSCILWLKLFLLNGMEQHNRTEREMTPESGKLSSNSTFGNYWLHGHGTKHNLSQGLFIFIMRSTVPISESCGYEMSLGYSRTLVNDSYK